MFLPACLRASGQIEEGAGLEGNEQRFVDDRDAVHLPFGRLQCVVIARVEENRREADDILFYGDGRQAHIFRKIEGPRLARKELDHEREALILRLMKAIELLLAVASLARLISACIEKRLNRRAKCGVDHLDTEHHVDVLGRSEWETGGIEQQVACRTADDRVVVLMPGENAPETSRCRLPWDVLQEMFCRHGDTFVTVIPELRVK